MIFEDNFKNDYLVLSKSQIAIITTTFKINLLVGKQSFRMNFRTLDGDK